MAVTLSDEDKARLIDRVGVDHVGVVDGPLVDPHVIESRLVFDDTSLEWAQKRLLRHARGLNANVMQPDASTPNRHVSIVYVTPDEAIHQVTTPRPAKEVAASEPEPLRIPLLAKAHAREGRMLGSWRIAKVSRGGRYVEVVMVSEKDLGSRFRGKRYRFTFDGFGYARSRT